MTRQWVCAQDAIRLGVQQVLHLRHSRSHIVLDGDLPPCQEQEVFGGVVPPGREHTRRKRYLRLFQRRERVVCVADSQVVPIGVVGTEHRLKARALADVV